MKIVNTDDIMTALCQHCDSHIEMCEECGMREIIESVPSAWISCEDRLPEKSGYYITYSRYLGVWHMRWSSVIKAWNCSDDCDEHRIDSVTHWMPLPDAPEGGRMMQANGMTNIQNACVLLIRELYKTEPTGGDLHIVTDDFNVEDSHLAWCEQVVGEYISRENEEWVVMLEITIIRALELLTEDERMEVVTKA